MPYDGLRAVTYQMAAFRGRPESALVLSGEMVVENTRPAIPTLLGRTRVQISRGTLSPLFVDVDCPALLVPGAGLLLGNPGRMVCPFRVPMPNGGFGGIQGQVSVALAGPSGQRTSEPMPYDFARAVPVELGRCATLRGDTPAGQGLARSRFRDGRRIGAPNNRICQSVTFDYTQLVGPFPITGCGEYQVQQSIAVDPDGRMQPRSLAVAGARVLVTGCERPPALGFASAEIRAVRAFEWRVSKAATSEAAFRVPYTSAVSIDYEVRYDRAPAAAVAYQVLATVQVDNPNFFQINLGYVQVELAGPRAAGSAPPTARADCPVDAEGRVAVAPQSSITCAVAWPAPAAGSGLLAVRPQAFGLDGARFDGAATQLDWAEVVVSEVGRCALISDTFARTAADPLSEPSTLEGNAPPPQGQERRICAPAVFRYTANWGPWRRSDCMLTEPYNLAALTVPDTQQTAADFVIASIDITGCPPPPVPLPRVRVGKVVTENITAEHRWSVEHKLTPELKSLSTTVGGFRKVDVATSFRRSAPVKVARFTAKGSLTLTNPTAAPMEVERVVVFLSRGRRPPINATASCPGAAAGGRLLLPPSPAAVTCSWAAPYPDSRASAAGAVAYLPSRRNATSNMAPFDFSRAPATTAGPCAVISDTFQWNAPPGAPQPKVGAGSKAPSFGAGGSRVCGGQSFAYTLQVGGFTADNCKQWVFRSIARAAPTSGFLKPVSNELVLPILCKP
ncbi:MAG: hypothetical protein J3K34DRAFT_417964 [Monoraphidium minutum]|nr:MAG: hypothetical protein J3K34DRAFT_417964 [Monoraphidium minutum]